MDSVIYHVEHETRYVHAGWVSTSRHVGCLTPRTLPWQAVHTHALSISPVPADLATRDDVFGNRVTQFGVLTPYTELRVVARSLVELLPRLPDRIDPCSSPAWETVRDGTDVESAEFLYESPYVDLGEELAAFAKMSLGPGRPLLDGAIDLMHRIHDGFTFDAAATSITTPVSRVLAEKGGVCQDFAHLQIGCLRSLGLPARYVSGYLLTDPPTGQERLVGADASHAWLSVWCPRYGWVDLDPTNAVLPDQRHVTTAWGRDYGDVSPLRGVATGSSAHELYVAVSVAPVLKSAANS